MTRINYNGLCRRIIVNFHGGVLRAHKSLASAGSGITISMLLADARGRDPCHNRRPYKLWREDERTQCPRKGSEGQRHNQGGPLAREPPTFQP